jgi:hypothetical protein
MTKGRTMKIGSKAALQLLVFTLWWIPRPTFAQDNKVLGQVEFQGKGKVEKTAGVWVDDHYVGYLKELKGDKRVMLLPGEHRISVRQSGYDDFQHTIVVEPGQKTIVHVKLLKSARAYTPSRTATLKLTIGPDRAAVFLDGKYVGHAGEFGGAFRSMEIETGKHRIKVELPGYRTYETEVNLVEGQKAEVKTELLKTTIENSGSSVRPPKP